MRHFILGALALSSTMAAPVYADVGDVPVTLEGSPESMVRQNEVARAKGFPFAETRADVREFERSGDLVRLEGNADYELADFVRYSQARPAMRTFIERLSAQYRRATGEKLVVTSLSRPATGQPGNAHDLSVHPAGMAVDLRVSRRVESRRWLEDALLALERRDVLDVTREMSPPHYHVAVFPEAYMAHVEHLRAEEAAREAAEPRGRDEQRSARGAEEGRRARGTPVVAWMMAAILPATLGALLRHGLSLHRGRPGRGARAFRSWRRR